MVTAHLDVAVQDVARVARRDDAQHLVRQQRDDALRQLAAVLFSFLVASPQVAAG